MEVNHQWKVKSLNVAQLLQSLPDGHEAISHIVQCNSRSTVIEDSCATKCVILLHLKSECGSPATERYDLLQASQASIQYLLSITTKESTSSTTNTRDDHWCTQHPEKCVSITTMCVALL